MIHCPNTKTCSPELRFLYSPSGILHTILSGGVTATYKPS